MIYNEDGTPYQPLGSLTQYDPLNQSHKLFNFWDQESIKIGGSPIFLYTLFIQTSGVDPVYFENRNKIWSNNPIQLYCYYEPISSQNLQGLFGIDSPDSMIFEFNYQAVLNTVGHVPKRGSRLFTPHLRENWVVVQPNTSVYNLWGVLRLQLLCERFQESSTTGEGKITQASIPQSANPVPQVQVPPQMP